MKRPLSYYEESQRLLAAIPVGVRPTLLLHACCGPCSCSPLLFLCPHFAVTIYFNNSNIYPAAEYERRLGELRRLLAYFLRDYGYDVPLVVPPYDNEAYNRDLAPLASAPEGGERCRLCYRKRLAEAYAYAESHHFAYVTTVMTVSRQKDSQILNALGEELAQSHPGTRYFHSDFKKKGGIEQGQAMRKHYGLYNQLYCGCKYTYPQGLAKAREKGFQEPFEP